MTLEEIGKQEYTEKVGHGYLPIYEKLWASLKEETINLLEIGVYNGNSLRTWCRWFPNATIIGIEKNQDNPMKVNRAQVYFGDQADKDFLITVAGKYDALDIVIDDGGHYWEEQQISFQTLWPSVRSGGMYIIEDLHTSEDDFWSSRGYCNTLDFLKGLTTSVVLHYTNIRSIEFHPKMAVIHKAP